MSTPPSTSRTEFLEVIGGASDRKLDLTGITNASSPPFQCPDKCCVVINPNRHWGAPWVHKIHKDEARSKPLQCLSFASLRASLEPFRPCPPSGVLLHSHARSAGHTLQFHLQGTHLGGTLRDLESG